MRYYVCAVLGLFFGVYLTLFFLRSDMRELTKLREGRAGDVARMETCDDLLTKCVGLQEQTVEALMNLRELLCSVEPEAKTCPYPDK